MLQISPEMPQTGNLRIVLTGRLDATTSPQLDKFINGYSQEPVSILIFDLSGLEFVSSAGLRIFAKARKMMKNKGGQVLFTNLTPPVQKVFDLVKAVPVAEVFRSDGELDTYLTSLQTGADSDDEADIPSLG